VWIVSFSSHRGRRLSLSSFRLRIFFLVGFLLSKQRSNPHAFILFCYAKRNIKLGRMEYLLVKRSHEELPLERDRIITKFLMTSYYQQRKRKRKKRTKRKFVAKQRYPISGPKLVCSPLSSNLFSRRSTHERGSFRSEHQFDSIATFEDFEESYLEKNFFSSFEKASSLEL